MTGAYTTMVLAGVLDVGETGTGHFMLSGGADAQAISHLERNLIILVHSRRR